MYVCLVRLGDRWVCATSRSWHVCVCTVVCTYRLRIRVEDVDVHGEVGLVRVDGRWRRMREKGMLGGLLD